MGVAAEFCGHRPLKQKRKCQLFPKWKGKRMSKFADNGESGKPEGTLCPGDEKDNPHPKVTFKGHWVLGIYSQ